MRKTRNNENQFSFDFGFNNSIEVAERLQEAINDSEPDNAIADRGQGNTTGHTGYVPQVAREPLRLDNTGPLGNEFRAEAPELAAARRNSVIQPAPGATESGTIPSGNEYAQAGRRADGTGNTSVEPDTNRAVASPRNYVITDSDRLGEGGAKTKYRDNVVAIQTLKKIEAELRPATPEEQALLVRYVGWGGIPQAFDHRNDDWSTEFHELSALLTKEEYEAARRSTQDAHYTSQIIIEGIYDGLARIGFDGGKILEPSVGTGNFIGLLPEALREQSSITGIELDPVTAKIAEALYPEASIINRGFESVAIPQHHFDLVIGNPPFGNQQVFDEHHPELSRFSIHNYFIAKSLEKTRPGGVVAVVVSRFFLDSQDKVSREYVADRAHFLGAIRLPNNAFKKNALTEVTTDIVFLKKAAEGEIPDRAWIELGGVQVEGEPEPFEISSWYVQHPELMLGELKREKMHAWATGPAVVARDSDDLEAGLAKAILALPEGIYRPRTDIDIDSLAEKPVIDIPEHVRVGGYFISGQQIVRRLPDILDEKDYEVVEPKNDRAAARIRSLITVRDNLRELMREEHSEWSSDEHLERLRTRLNRVYDDHVKRHGYISAIVNRQSMGDDPDYPLLQSLEHDYDKGISKEVAQREGVEPREPSVRKAPIFTKRVIKPRREISQVTTAKDALVVALNETGRVNLPRMVQLYGQSEDRIIEDLDGLIFLNPVTNEWESRDKYLTGNVKDKLRVAELAVAQDPRIEKNVHALREVQPVDIEPVDIAVQLGSTWVPGEVVSDFVGHLLGNVHRNISYQPTLGKWVAKIGFGDPTTCRVQWGTEDVPANQLIMSILENRSIQVKQRQGTSPSGAPIYVVLEDRTTAANQKADEIRQAFLDWVWEDKDRREKLARIYNDRFNTNIAPRYDGSHLTLSGASMAIELRAHQKNAIWRGIQEGTVLEDHVVGAGKTLVFVGTAMESKRMGLMSKPMFVVPNHLLLQWKDAFYSLYPDANILVAEKTDFEKDNRQLLFSKIATGDWDAVIVAHSSFKKIGMPPDMLKEILEEQVNDLVDAIEQMKRSEGDRFSIKEMEKARDRMKAKLARLSDTGRKDNAVDFGDLGIDALFVDEAHEFKNLFINTSMNRISGLGNLAGSDKAFDMFVKTRYIQKKNEGRGVFFATGTPISNTIAELYTMQRYMQYDELCRRNIVHFDAWASTFGQVVAGWELDATGVNYRLNSRFAKFQNVPELIALYRTFADVVTKKDLDDYAEATGQRPLTPRVKGGKPQNIVVERSKAQEQYMGVLEPVYDDAGNPIYKGDGTQAKDWNEGSIIWRMENLPSDPRLDNPLKITNDARKAGLDFRLIDPFAEDDTGSKVNTMVGEVYRVWKAWEARKGTQLVFCDLSTPKAKKEEVQIATPLVIEVEGEDNPEENSISMDEVLASGSQKFSVYDDVKQKLIGMGVPEHEIKFIHEFKTDLQKARLFAQMNRGEVRILLGSTAKMGAGTNVQRLLVAEHHLDAPWRPSDLEQREGRIIRQGNLFYEEDPDNFEVEIMRYATKQTYDSRMWQTIEYKAGGIEQFRRGDSLQRVIEDVASEAANAAEMKAAATGNPLIFLQVQLSSELKKQEAIYANYKRTRHTLESKLAWLSNAEDRAQRNLESLDKELSRRQDNNSLITAEGTFTEKNRDAATNVILSAMERAIKSSANGGKMNDQVSIPLGQYRGFDLAVFATSSMVQFTIKGERTHSPENLHYRREDNFSTNGFFQRLDNWLGRMEEGRTTIRLQLEADKEELVKVQHEMSKPFAQLEQLQLLRKDVSDVLGEIRKAQGDENYKSMWLPKSVPPPPELLAMHTSRQNEEIERVPDSSVAVETEPAEPARSSPIEMVKQFSIIVPEEEQKNGIYIGEITSVISGYVFQNIGGRLVRHDPKIVQGLQEIAVGQKVRVEYSMASGLLQGHSRTQQQDKTAMVEMSL